MVDADDGPAPEARPPNVADLVSLCRHLNREQARYVVLGGMAIIQAHVVTIDGVPIPFASLLLLWRPKQTVRDKDRLDRAFLARLLGDAARERDDGARRRRHR